jgi:diguanylate cyclase (GGDEF)-like protein
MNLSTRLRAAACRALLGALLLPLAAAATPAAASATPAAGPPAAAEASPEQLRSLLTERRLDEANALAETLLAEPGLPPARETELLILWMKGLFAAGDLSRIAQLEPRVQALAANDAVPAADRASLLHQLASLYTRVPRFADALAMFGQIEAVLGDAPDKQLLDALSAKGAVHAMQGQNAEAIEALHRAEQMGQALGLPENANLLRNLAGLFIGLGEFDRAIDYARRGEEAQRKQDPPPPPQVRKGMLSVLATAYISAKDFEQGQRWSETAIAFGREHGLPVTAELNNYATLLRDTGRHAEALAIYRDLTSQVAPTDAPEIRGVLEKNIGETLVALGRRAEAAGHLQAARELYETADVRPKRLELYPVLIDNLDALGRHAEALAALREFKALSDETINAESQTRIGQLENAIDLERKEKALAEAEAANELQRAANEALQAGQERARAINIALAASLVALAALLALLWRTVRIRARTTRELSARNQVIEQLSREDALTGLGNRRRLLEVMAEAQATGSLVVMADLDHFKAINDQHGHDTGDRALKLFADALRAVARSGDLMVRWGGEEFVWVCRGADAAQGPALCDRLLRQLRENPLDVGGQPLPVTASLGFVPLPTWPGATPDWDAALRIADYGVYCSKNAGRNRWTGFAGVDAAPGEAVASPAALEQQGKLKRLG